MQPNITPTPLPGLLIVEPPVFGDARGFFMESYHAEKYAGRGIDPVFVQDNYSHSAGNILRGLHYQIKHPQAKLVSVLSGSIYDVAVDIRRGSPTFGRWMGISLSAENKKQLFIPAGFAHGFYVVSETANVFYKCSDYYYPAGERGILWSDPGLGIDWPFAGEPVLSDKDRAYPCLAHLPEVDLPEYSI